MENQGKKRIVVKSASKRFNVGHKGGESILTKVIGMFSGREHRKNVVAIDNISLEAHQGEAIGIIGDNGSGKSTLLRLIAGIYEADGGSLTTHGSVMYINGFNHGTRPRLTMSENIFLAGSVLGLKTDEIRSKFDEIVDFSGLGEYADTKVYQFSSGMLARLNFSIFIHSVDVRLPDIILFDEVLNAGGDIDFKNKAKSKIEELVRRGSTVLLVSHQLNDIEKYCQRVLWIDKGAIRGDGETSDIINKYRVLHKIN